MARKPLTDIFSRKKSSSSSRTSSSSRMSPEERSRVNYKNSTSKEKERSSVHRGTEFFDHSSRRTNSSKRQKVSLGKLGLQRAQERTIYGFRIRMLSWALVVALVLTIAVGKLVYTQLINGPAIAQAATNSRIVTKILPAHRGDILGSTGEVLAHSVEKYTIYADQIAAAAFKPIPCTGTNPGVCTAYDGKTPKVQGVQAVADLIAPLLKMPMNELVSLLTGNTRYSVLKRDVSPQVKRQLDALNLNSVIGTIRTSTRQYTDPMTMGTLLGMVNGEGQGVAGIEKMENSVLEGKNGSITYQQGADGQQIPGTPVKRIEPQNGGTVKLTINPEVQWYAHHALEEGKKKTKAKWGIAIVEDVKTGQLVAATDTGDNNLEAVLRGSLAMTTTFNPGSIGKIIMAAYLIQHGIQKPTSRFVVPYSITVDGQTFHDAEWHKPEHLTLAGIIQQSSNVGIIEAARSLTNDQRYDILKDFGIGVSSNIGYPGDSIGILPPPQTWDLRTRQTVLFGQGYSASALQMANVASTIANGGVMHQQSLIDSITQDGKTKSMLRTKSRRIISEQTAKDVLNMMESVTEIYAPFGVKVPGYRIAGKSGTAQVVGKSGKLTNIIGDWDGIIPADHPRFVVMVAYMDPTPEYGGMSAGPVMAKIGAFLMQKYSVPESAPRTDAIPVTW